MAGSIPTKAKWQSDKKKYDVPSGLSKANMGKLFDDYEAGAKKGRLDSVKPLHALSKAIPQYIADAKKKKDKKIDKFVKEVVEPIDKYVDELIKLYQKLANPTAAFSMKLKKCAASLQKLPATPSKTEYNAFWSEDVRDVGTALAALKKLDPSAEKLHKLWLPLTKDPSSIPEAKLGAVRKLVGATIKTLYTEGQKLHLIA